jgi:hypothetical protein
MDDNQAESLYGRVNDNHQQTLLPSYSTKPCQRSVVERPDADHFNYSIPGGGDACGQEVTESTHSMQVSSALDLTLGFF